MTTWLTTAQVLEHTELAVSQQAVKKAAKRYYERCTAAGAQPEYVRKNGAGRWEIRSDWALFQSWQQRGADRAGRVREQHEREEELTRLRALCAEQAQRIEELEAALANLQGGKGTVPHETADCGEEPNTGTVPPPRSSPTTLPCSATGLSEASPAGARLASRSACRSHGARST